MSTATSSFPQFHSSPLFNPTLSPLYHNNNVPTTSRPMTNSTNSSTCLPPYQASRWKHAPIPQRHTLRPGQRRESRRAALLQGVQERRQSARDQTRSEQILRSDVFAEQRAWELAQEAEAARWATREEEEELQAQSDVELEDLLRREEEELLARADQAMLQDRDVDRIGGESDADFDMLVLEAVEEFERSLQQNGQRDMDLS